MATRVYDYGDGFRLQATFTVGVVNTDPTTITFSLKNPNDVIINYVYGTHPEVVKSALGIYYLDVMASVVGTWYYRVAGTGAVIAAHEGSFVVRTSQFA